MRTRYQGPEASPGLLLWRATLAWQRDVTAALGPLGLTHSQFVILACVCWLEDHERAGTQTGISAQAGMDAKNTSQVLKRLERDGLVTRQADPGDARARIVRATGSGRRLCEQAVPAVEAVDEAYFAAHPALREALLSGPARP